MARERGPRFKKCRRLGLNVCGHPKAMKKDNQKVARDARKLSEYGLQLLEKQRLRGYYEVLEKQMLRYVRKAMNSNENTGEALVKSLETRLDNMVYRAKFASSIRQARQMVSHGHFLVNNKKVDIPSYAVSPGDIITLREKSRNTEMFKNNFVENTIVPPYVSKDVEKFTATLLREPERTEIPIQIEDRYVVEFYSRIK